MGTEMLMRLALAVVALVPIWVFSHARPQPSKSQAGVAVIMASCDYDLPAGAPSETLPQIDFERCRISLEYGLVGANARKEVELTLIRNVALSIASSIRDE